MARIWYFLLGIVALALGLIGILLPGLPTTPFLLVAAFGFSRSSDRVHNWLLDHQIFGTLIRDWQDRGAISRRAKFYAVSSIIAAFMFSWFIDLPLWALALQGMILGVVAIFLITRPE